MLTMLSATQALAVETVKGAEPGLFGKPTSVDEVMTIGSGPTETDNINRSKDSAMIPPSFGSPGSNTLGIGAPLTPGLSSGAPISGSSVTTANISGAGGTTIPPSTVESSVSLSYSSKFTLPDNLFYADGSIGALSIPKLSVTARVYEDESLENLKKGIGHFKSTSCWDGNVGFAAHNRGLADYFEKIHTLKSGDQVIYTTKLGTRTYEVYFVGQVCETDLSRLGRTEENIVSLYTCVRDIPELRVCVQARQVS